MLAVRHMQAGLAMHASPLAGITNRPSSQAPAVGGGLAVGGGKSAKTYRRYGPDSVATQTETCGVTALGAAGCGATRLVRLATLGRQSALACVSTCLAAVQGMPWMM